MLPVRCLFDHVPNIGDHASAPSRYFNDELPMLTEDMTWQNPPVGKFAGHTIIGGGGIFYRHRNDPGGYVMQRTLELLRDGTAGRMILWGAGTNDHIDCSDTDELHWPDASMFDLIGSRDQGFPRADWVPCASCMHSAFDGPEHERSVHVLVFHTRDSDRLPKQQHGYPQLDNTLDRPRLTDMCVHAIVHMMRGTKIVVTDSYHGMYWATLAGCHVITIRRTGKARHFPFVPEFATYKTWQDAVRSHIESGFANMSTYPDALSRCRIATIAFKDKVKELISE